MDVDIDRLVFERSMRAVRYLVFFHSDDELIDLNPDAHRARAVSAFSCYECITTEYHGISFSFLQTMNDRIKTSCVSFDAKKKKRKEKKKFRYRFTTHEYVQLQAIDFKFDISRFMRCYIAGHIVILLPICGGRWKFTYTH